jgi:hypothetical protein
VWSVLSTHSSQVSITTDVSDAMDMRDSKPSLSTIAGASSTCGSPNTTASHAPRRLSPIKIWGPPSALAEKEAQIK